MSLIWEAEEIQGPVAGRKCSPAGGSPRPLDPPPVVQLTCSLNGRHFDPTRMPGFSLESIACGVDLFRLPDGPPTRMGSSYYARDGTLDSNRQPVYQLLYTDYPEQIPGRPYEAVIGNHLIFESSAETHLLYRQTLSQLNQTADGRLLFTFGNIGVLQTGRYLLRYSVCNSRTHQTLVKCFGRPFTISSVNQFPGLQPATPLTQSLGGLRIPGMGGRH